MHKPKIILSALLLAFLCACQPPAPVEEAKPTIKVAGRQSSSSELTDEEKAVVPPDKGLLQLAEDFNDSTLALTVECPETKDNPSLRVEGDVILSARVASMLMQSVFEVSVPKPATDPELEARELLLEARNGARYSRVRLFGFDENHPFYGGKALVQIENNSGATFRYLYDKALFDEIDAEIQRRVQGISVSFSGDCRLLGSRYNLEKIKREDGLWIGEFLQFGSNIVWRFAQGDPTAKNGVVEMVSAANGRSVYGYQLDEPIVRMEKYSGPEGGDYRIFTPTRILYKDSGKPAWQQEWRLPATAMPFVASAQLSGGFDRRFGKLAYATEDGLYVADENGANDELILEHNALDAVMPQQGGMWYLNDPRLMLDGTRLVSSIVSTQHGSQRMGFAVSDLDTLETTYFTTLQAADQRMVRYPVDRAVSVQEPTRLSLIDTKTTEMGSMPFEGLEGTLFFTDDYNEFIIAERPYVSEGEHGTTTLYRATSDRLHDRSDKLLVARGDVFYPVAITENYLIGYCEDARGVFLTASVYHKKAKKPLDELVSSSSAPQSSAADETTSSFDEEDEAYVDDEDDLYWDEESSSSSKSSSGKSSSSSRSASNAVYDENGNYIGELPPDITPDWMREFLQQNAARNPYSSGSSEQDVNPYFDLYGTKEYESLFGQNEYMKPYESLFGTIG